MSVTDQEVNAFLAHYGVKGMHWGIRRRDSNADGQPSNRRKIAKRVGIGVTVAAGAAVTAAILYKVGATRSSSFSAKNLNSASSIINAERHQKVAAIIRTHKEGHISKEQMENFVSSLNKRYDKKVVDALRDVAS